MLLEEFKFCKIIALTKEDYNSLLDNIKLLNSLVDIVDYSDDKDININSLIENTSCNTLIIGYSSAKKIFKNIENIKVSPLESQITETVFWADKLDNTVLINNKNKFIENINNFINNSIKYILSHNQYFSYDAVLDGEFENFCNNILNKTQNIFLYFNKKTLYVCQNNKSFGVNLESIRYVGLDVKKIIDKFISQYSCIFFDYENIYQYININPDSTQFLTFENIFWNYYNEEININSINNLFRLFPNFEDIKRHIPFLISKLLADVPLDQYNEISAKRTFRKDIITQWLSSHDIYLNNVLFEQIFEQKNINKIKIKFSNKKTLTGRINAVHNDFGFNPQMLNKENDERKCIISQFKDGKIIVFDYVAFETKISLHLTANKEFIANYQDKDLHYETAKVIYKKDELTADERKMGKDINHAILYGGGDEKIKEILKDTKGKTKIISAVKEFLKPIFDTSDYVKNVFEEIGYIKNDFGVIVRPEKKWAVFQNYVQSMAVEIVVEQLFCIKNMLMENKFKSKFLFQVHDSFVFDVKPDEQDIFVVEINKILCTYKHIKFEVKHTVGNNFFEASK